MALFPCWAECLCYLMLCSIGWSDMLRSIQRQAARRVGALPYFSSPPQIASSAATRLVACELLCTFYVMSQCFAIIADNVRKLSFPNTTLLVSKVDCDITDTHIQLLPSH